MRGLALGLKSAWLKSTVVGALLLSAAIGCEDQKKSASLPPPMLKPPTLMQVQPQPPKATPAQTYSPQYTQVPGTINGVPRAWIPSVKAKQYSWIFIHHTATPAGNLARIDASHRAKGWDCIGYDFVVGNGTESKDGQVEVGPRWTRQMIGAHTKSPDGSNKYNEKGIGIVMVGNFDETRPSAKQVHETAELVAYLMKTYHVPPDRVLGHRNVKATDCPGKFTDVAAIRRTATKMLADAGIEIPADDHFAVLDDAPTPLPSGELMHDALGE